MRNITAIYWRLKFFYIIMMYCTVSIYGQERPKMERLLSINPTSVHFGAEGGSKTFIVNSNGTWNISSVTKSWGHLIKNGNHLTLRVDKNTETSSRNDSFELTSGDKKVRVSITQSGSDILLSVSSENIHFGSTGGTKTLTITTNGIWQIGTNTASWGHLTKNGNQLNVKVDPNTSTSSRTDWFTIIAGNTSKRINISQSGKTVSSTTKSAIIKTVSVYNDADVDGKKGLSVHIAFDISGMKQTNANVSCYFYDSSGNALIDTNGNYGTVGTPSCVAINRNITPEYANTTYSDLELKIPYDELHILGTHPRTLQVDVLIWDYGTSNHTVMTRKEGITFTCIPNISYLKVGGNTSDKTKYFSEYGGREYYSVITNASSYETWGVPSWCSIEDKTSTGFILVCERNTSTSSRNDYMKVKAAGHEIRIDIKQEAASGPSATITSVEQEHNVFNGYTKGMKINLKFDVNGMLNKTVNTTAWFYYSDNTTRLKNGYGGQVNVSRSDTAPYENTTFTVTLFMPYQSLNMAHGFNGYLSFDIIISDSSGNRLAKQENNRFTYFQP